VFAVSWSPLKLSVPTPRRMRAGCQLPCVIRLILRCYPLSLSFGSVLLCILWQLMGLLLHSVRKTYASPANPYKQCFFSRRISPVLYYPRKRLDVFLGASKTPPPASQNRHYETSKISTGCAVTVDSTPAAWHESLRSLKGISIIIRFLTAGAHG